MNRGRVGCVYVAFAAAAGLPDPLDSGARELKRRLRLTGPLAPLGVPVFKFGALAELAGAHLERWPDGEDAALWEGTYPFRPCPTVGAFARHGPAGRFILASQRHAVALVGIHVTDPRGEAVWNVHPARRMRVLHCFRLTPRAPSA